MNIHVKRIYEPFATSDGYRILIDRLWPRGIKKEDAHIDKWQKEIAPSTELRKWIHADPGKWTQFRAKYRAELSRSPALEELLSDIGKHKTITLLYAVKNEEHNHALLLREFLLEH
jgi:uncharacterized protein YeaO (DUF488 family)